MKLAALLFSLTMMLMIAPLEASAQSGVSARGLNVRELVTQSCKYYRGQSLESLTDPTYGLQNPLLPSPIGRMSYGKNFKQGFIESNYLSLDEVIEKINSSPELDAALDQCYGKNEQVKISFLFLMNQIQYQAKSDAFFTTVGSFFVQGALFMKVATRLPFSAAISTWMKTVGAVKWGSRVILTYAGIVTAKSVYKLIQYKRGKIQKQKLELPNLESTERVQALEELKAETESLESIKAFAIQDLENSIRALKGQTGSIKDPNRRAQLQALLRESEKNLADLKAS